ncbi:MAG TPA: hypothetical protein VFL86_14720 [Burkholderiaceae bacterium]|nr:hypothetical protein [Burkholderiaceae bacterium]
MDNIDYLCRSAVTINLACKDPAEVEADVRAMLAEAPLTAKCVLSHEHHAGKPSLYIRNKTGDQSPEIVYAARSGALAPLDDIDFAVNYVSAWKKNHHAWPVVYAYFQPPRDVPPELISGIDAMPIADLRTRSEVCDLSDAGFRPYHGDKAPDKVTARIITIKVAQGDNKPVANAIEEQTRPGDVVLVDAGGPAATVTLGGITASLAEKVRGIKGVLIYGEVRDQAELRSLSIPVFGLGHSANGPSKQGPGAVHCSLNIGNIPFRSGDIIKIEGNEIAVVSCAGAASILGHGKFMGEGPAGLDAAPAWQGVQAARYRKTFEPVEKAPPKNLPRPETPAFIPPLFKLYTPAQICDTASFIKSGRLWGAGTDMVLRRGAIPEGETLVGEAVLASGSEQGIESALGKAKKGDFLIVCGGSEVRLTPALMGKIHERGLACIVVDGKVIVDDALCAQYAIPCFARGIGAAAGPFPEAARKEAGPLRRMELSDGFLIKPGYVMMADIDGIAGFSPKKFSILYRAGFRKLLQEQTAEQRNKSGHRHPLPPGSIIIDRYFEPFVHAHIDQFPFLAASRGWAKMQLPADPLEVQFGSAGRKSRLGADETLTGVPEKITTHGEKPMTFTLRSNEGDLQEVEGVSGRALFDVAVAAERGESIEVRGDGSVVKR